jgi:hypothetical protein
MFLLRARRRGALGGARGRDSNGGAADRVLEGGWPVGNRKRNPEPRHQRLDNSRIKRRLDHILGSVDEDCSGEWGERVVRRECSVRRESSACGANARINYSWIVIEHLALLILIFYDQNSIGDCAFSVSVVFISARTTCDSCRYDVNASKDYERVRID